jgi:hypothetical protein
MSILFEQSLPFHLVISSRVVTTHTTSVNSHLTFCGYGFCIIFSVNIFYDLNIVNQLIFVMVKCGVLFEVKTKFLNII